MGWGWGLTPFQTFSLSFKIVGVSSTSPRKKVKKLLFFHEIANYFIKKCCLADSYLNFLQTPGLHGKPLGWHWPLTYPYLHAWKPVWIAQSMLFPKWQWKELDSPPSIGLVHSTFGLQQSTYRTEINPSMNIYLYISFCKILMSNLFW